ncbi:5961_t:CDS:2, partial [Paraglomus occultum]
MFRLAAEGEGESLEGEELGLANLVVNSNGLEEGVKKEKKKARRQGLGYYVDSRG